MTLKTLKDMEKIFIPDFKIEDIEKLTKVNDNNPVVFSRNLTIQINKLYKQEAIKWIKEIRKKSKAHWKELDEKHYTGMDNPCSWELDGLTFNDWHEAADPSAAIMILKHFFNITEEDLK